MRFHLLLMVLIIFPGAFLFEQSGSNQSNSDLKKSVQGIRQLFKKRKTDSVAANGNNSVADNALAPTRATTA